MAAYATVQDIKDLGMLPDEDLDDLITSYPTMVAALIAAVSGVADSYLRKRHKLPLNSPYPPELVNAVVQIVVYRAYLKRGVEATSTDVPKQIIASKDEAMKWLLDVSTGTVELDTNADASPDVEEGGPLFGSSGQPFSWYDQVQASQGYGNWGPKSGGCC